MRLALLEDLFHDRNPHQQNTLVRGIAPLRLSCITTDYKAHDVAQA